MIKFMSVCDCQNTAKAAYMSQWRLELATRSLKQSTLFEVSADGLARHWPFAGNEKSGHVQKYH
jgi:hypothetical protein